MKKNPLLILLVTSTMTLAQESNFQPFAAHTRRVIETLDQLGEPLPRADRAKLLELAGSGGAGQALEKIAAVLDARCLFVVDINPEMRVKVARGPANADPTGAPSPLLKQTEIVSKCSPQRGPGMPVATIAFHSRAPSRCMAISFSRAQRLMAAILSSG